MAESIFNVNVIHGNMLNVLMSNLNIVYHNIEYIEKSYEKLSYLTNNLFYQIYGTGNVDDFKKYYKPYLDIIKDTIKQLEKEISKHGKQD